jgi:hypothetical protein
VSTERERWLSWAALAITVLGLMLWIHPEALQLGLSERIGGAFHPGHAWAMDRVSQMLFEGAAWSGDGTPLAYPEAGHARFIAWAGLLFGAAISPVTGLIPAYHLTVAANLWASAVLCAVLLRRATDCRPAAATGAALVYALGPPALGFLANGQLAKLHLWCLPLCLLALDHALGAAGPRQRAGRTVLCMLAALITGFSVPSAGLLVPFAGIAWALVRLRGRWVNAVLGLGGLAAGLGHGAVYHLLPGEGLALMRPAAPIPGLVHPDFLSPVSRPIELLLGQARWSGAADGVNNISYLGLPALLLALWWVARRPRAHTLGIALCGLGIMLALGPAIETTSTRWVLPAVLLEWTHYPITQSGMYYRFSLVAGLGLALIIARGGQGKSHWWLCWAVGAANIAAGLWATAPIWPRPLEAVPGMVLLETMRADPTPGAVLELPLAALDTEGGRGALAAAFHHRASTATIHHTSIEASARLKRLDTMLQSDRLAADLAQAGFRYVVLRPSRSSPANSQTRERLRRALGAPALDQEIQIWTVPSR